MTETVGFAERIGGRWAVSLRAWLVVAGAFIVQSALAAAAQDSGMGDRAARVAVALGAALVSGAVMLAADRTLLRSRAEQPAPVAAVLGVYVAVGFGVYAVIVATDWVVPFGFPGGDATSGPMYPYVAGLIVVPGIVGVLTGCAVIFDAFDRLRRRSDDLIARLDGLAVDAEVRSELARSLVDSAEREIGAATRGVIDELDRVGGELTPSERLALVERLDAVLQTTVRPLAQRYATAPRAAGANRWDLLRTSLLHAPLRPAISTIAFSILLLLFAGGRFGLAFGAAQAAVQLPVMYVPLAVLARLQGRGRLPAGSALALGVAATVVVTVVRAFLMQELILGNAVPANLVSGAVWSAVTVVFTSAVVATLGARRDDIRELEEALDARLVAAARANSEVAHTSRELARYVHGTLQSTLLATAFAMERANRADDPVAFAEAAAAASAALSAARPVSPDVPDVAAAVERQRELWGEFTTIDAKLDTKLSPSTHAVRAVDLILEEGISNAMKHGGATRLDVEIDDAGDGRVRIRIADDGSGLGDGRPGAGSALLDQLAPDAWSIAARPDAPGAVLTAIIAG